MKDQLINVLYGVLIIVLPAVSGYIAQYYKNKTEQLKANTKSEIVKDTIANADKIISTVVSALNQNTVNDLKAAAADGKLTDDEKKLIFNEAKSTILQTISDKDLGILRDELGSFDTWLESKITEFVAKHKVSNAPTNTIDPHTFGSNTTTN